MPQMVGGEAPVGLVTEKESVRHWPDTDCPAFPVVVGTPFFVKTVEVVEVDGPVMVKDTKSRRSCKKNPDIIASICEKKVFLL